MRKIELHYEKWYKDLYPPWELLYGNYFMYDNKRSVKFRARTFSDYFLSAMMIGSTLTTKDNEEDTVTF